MKDKEIIISIESEITFLKEIINDPSILRDNKILSSIKDQKSFSSYYNNDLNIRSYSLNSHKTYANNILIGGYPYLDSLRKKCLTAFQNHTRSIKKSSKVTISSLTTNIQDIKNENDALKKHNLLLTALTNQLTEKLDFYVSNSKDNEIIYDYQNFKKQIECMVRFIELEL